MKFWEFTASWELILSSFLIYHEVALRTLRIALFRREVLLRDQVELVVPFSKKFYQAALIDWAS